MNMFGYTYKYYVYVTLYMYIVYIHIYTICIRPTKLIDDTVEKTIRDNHRYFPRGIVMYRPLNLTAWNCLSAYEKKFIIMGIHVCRDKWGKEPVLADGGANPKKKLFCCKESGTLGDLDTWYGIGLEQDTRTLDVWCRRC